MNGNSGNEEEQQIPESYILIRFAAPGATLMDVQFKGIYPGQFIVASDYLLGKGRKFMEQLEREQEEKEKLITPGKAKIYVPK